MNFAIGDWVQWKWMGRTIEGTVKDVFTEKISKVIKGKSIVRKGSKENPACLVESEAGNLALKLSSELQPRVRTSKSQSRPKMFSP